tara:strand:- start:5763 stop:5963 length:201 start_codon:yes stop_codon:yes gene_type:complete
MYTVYNYIVAFWSVVVMNCIQPVNWKYCLPVHEWLIPELKQGIEIYFDKQHKMLYKSERDYLKSIK